jgi:hypothetical protein
MATGQDGSIDSRKEHRKIEREKERRRKAESVLRREEIDEPTRTPMSLHPTFPRSSLFPLSALWGKERRAMAALAECGTSARDKHKTHPATHAKHTQSGKEQASCACLCDGTFVTAFAGNDTLIVPLPSVLL